MTNIQIPNGTNSDHLVLDQADYLDESLHFLMPGKQSAWVDLTNTSSTSEVFNISANFNSSGDYGEVYLTASEGMHIRLNAGGPTPSHTEPPRFTVHLHANSTLEFSPEFIAEHKDNPYEMQAWYDHGREGSATVIFDTTGLEFNYPNRVMSGGKGPGPGDVIKVVNATDTYLNEWNTLVFKDDAGDVLMKVSLHPNFNHELIIEDGEVTVACFIKGTHIATTKGEVKVESLKAGDIVHTASGGIGSVKWVGFRKLNRNQLPPEQALRASPIRICKGAFSENVPHRDLTVSPGHHFNFDGALVPALSLVNGLTITQDFEIEQFEYYHVELEKFDMLLAEGAAAESYLEVGTNRNSFQNARTVTAHPDFGPAPKHVMLAEYVQKITPEIIEPIRRELFKRAEILTGAVRTSDTDLRIEVNGQIINPQTPCKKKGLYRFELPAGLSGDIRILSNAAVVRETSLIDRTDTRVIGVGLAGVALITNDQRYEIDLSDSELYGLNEVQEMDSTPMRWTVGEAIIPARLLPESSTSVVLELNVLRTHMYWVSAQQERVRKVA